MDPPTADVECNTFTRPLCKRCCLIYQKFSGCDPCNKRSHRVNSIARYDIPTEDQHRQTWLAQEICQILKTTRDQAAQEIISRSGEEIAQMVDSSGRACKTLKTLITLQIPVPLPRAPRRAVPLWNRLLKLVFRGRECSALGSHRTSGLTQMSERRRPKDSRARSKTYLEAVPGELTRLCVIMRLLSCQRRHQGVCQSIPKYPRYQQLADPLVPALTRQQQPADYSPLVMGLDGRLKRKYSEVPE